MEYWGTRDYRDEVYGLSSTSYLGQGLAAQKPHARHEAGSLRMRHVITRRKLRITVSPSGSKSVVGPVDRALEKEFKKLVKQWRSAVEMISSPQEMAVHPAYQRIMAMGSPVIPLIIQELKTSGGHWYWALRFLANHDPVPKKAWGNVPEMKRIWIKWWEEKNPSLAQSA